MIVRLGIAFLLILLAFLLRKHNKISAVIIIIPALIFYCYFMYLLFKAFKRVEIINSLNIFLKDLKLDKYYSKDVFYFTYLFAYMNLVFSSKKYIKEIFFILVTLGFIFIGCKFISDVKYIYLINVFLSLVFLIFSCFQKNYVWIIIGLISFAFPFICQFDLINNSNFSIFMNFNYLTMILLSGLLVSLGIVRFGCDNE